MHVSRINQSCWHKSVIFHSSHIKSYYYNPVYLIQHVIIYWRISTLNRFIRWQSSVSLKYARYLHRNYWCREYSTGIMIHASLHNTAGKWEMVSYTKWNKADFPFVGCMWNLFYEATRSWYGHKIKSRPKCLVYRIRHDIRY